MDIVVTGSSGRLGSAVVRELLQHDHQVVGIDIRPSNDTAIHTHVLDLTRTADVRPLLKGAGAVCHLGNQPWVWGENRTPGFANNVTTTHSVFEAAVDNGVRRVIYASSIQAYGVLPTRKGDPRFMAPPHYLPIDEEHPLLPRDAYPLSKAMGEHIAESFCRQEPQLRAFSLRFTGIVDIPAQPTPDATAASLASVRIAQSIGSSLLTYIHVTDAARAVRLACQAPGAGHTALNILAPRPIRPWDRDQIQRLFGAVPEFRRDLTPQDPLISYEKARDVLGFMAQWGA